jgi:hypothetical protein
MDLSVHREAQASRGNGAQRSPREHSRRSRRTRVHLTLPAQRARDLGRLLIDESAGNYGTFDVR